jgi:hypothetical protein
MPERYALYHISGKEVNVVVDGRSFNEGGFGLT